MSIILIPDIVAFIYALLVKCGTGLVVDWWLRCCWFDSRLAH